GRNVGSQDISKHLSFSADGQTFLMPNGPQGGIALWELNSVEERGRLTGHESVVLAARFSPDGKTAVSAGLDGTLRVWDATSLKELTKVTVGEDVVTDLAVAPDGRTVALGSAHGRIRLWDLKTEKERAGGERLQPAVAIGFSPDGRSVIALDGRSI